jgi:hypothetical protein
MELGAFDEPFRARTFLAAWLALARCWARLSSMSRIAIHNSFTTARRGGNGHGFK